MAADQSPSNSNAIATSSNSGLRSDHVDFVVFCETNIDNIATCIKYNDTVGDLKRKIVSAFASIYKDNSKINVLAIKVERKGLIFNLSDSLLVRTVFGRDTGDWFVQVDAAPEAEKVDGVLNCKLLERKTYSFELRQTTNDTGSEKELTEQQIKRKTNASIVEGKDDVGNEKDTDGIMKKHKKSRRMQNIEQSLSLEIGNQAVPFLIEKKRCNKRERKIPFDKFMENRKTEEENSDIYQPIFAQNSEMTAKEQGNLRDVCCDNDVDGNVEKDTSSQRKNNNDCLSNLPADNNQAEVFSPEKKRRRKKKEKISKESGVNFDVNQPDSGEIPLDKLSVDKDENNVFGGVCDPGAIKMDFELLQSDLTKEKKRKIKSSRHTYETNKKVVSETGSGVPSLYKTGISLEAVNQVDEEDAKKSVSNKNNDYDFSMEKSALPEQSQCSPATMENDIAAADKVIEGICRQSSRYTVEALLEKIDAPFFTDQEPNSHEKFNKESGGEVGHQEVADFDIPFEISTEVCPAKDSRLSKHNRKKPAAKRSTNKFDDHSTTLADLDAVTAEINVEEVPNYYDDLCEQGNGEEIFEDSPDPVHHDFSIEACAKVHLTKDKGLHRIRKKAAKVDSSYQRLSNTKIINSTSGNIFVSEIPIEAQTFQSTVCEFKVPTVDYGNPSQASENVEDQKQVGGKSANEMSEVSLPVAPPSNRVEDLKAFDNVEGSASATAGINFAEYFCPQVVGQDIVVSAEEGKPVKRETKRMKKQKLKCKRDKKISNVHVQDSPTVSAKLPCSPGAGLPRCAPAVFSPVEPQSFASIGESPVEDAETKERHMKLINNGDMQNCNPSMQDRSTHSDNSQCSSDPNDKQKYHLSRKSSDSNTGSKDKETRITRQVGLHAQKSHQSKSYKEQVGDIFFDTEPEMALQKNEQVKTSRYIKRMTSTQYDSVIEDVSHNHKVSRLNNNEESQSNAAGSCVKEMLVSKCASIDTGDKTNYKAGNYQIAVREVPDRELEHLDSLSQDRTPLRFVDILSARLNLLEDEFHADNGKTSFKESRDTSFRSSDDNEKIDERKTVNRHEQASMSSPGVIVSATDCAKSKENHRNVTTTSGSKRAKSKLRMAQKFKQLQEK